MHKNKLLLNCGCAVGMLIGSSAIAQEVPSQTGKAAPDAVKAAAQAEQDGEIIVTALRREGNLQRAPVAVSVVSGEALQSAGVGGSQQLGQATPSLNFSRIGNNVIPTLRGVGTNNSTVGDDPNVAIYVDGVYKASSVGNDFALAGIQRVEVLKGPQGTLFGRNAEGGAILITTRAPSFTQFQSEGSVSYGERNNFEAKGFVSVPIADNIAFSLSSLYKRADGYFFELTRQQFISPSENFVIRPKLAAQLSDRFRADALFQYSYTSDATGITYAGVSRAGSQPAYLGLPAGANLPVPSKPREVALSDLPFNVVRGYDASLKFTYEGDAIKFSSQTSYTQTDLSALLDGDQGPLRIATSRNESHESSWQQEFLLSSTNESRFDWVAGIFLYSSRAAYDPRISGSSTDGVNPLPFVYNYALAKGRSIAPFAEGTFAITDRLKFTTGLRYTWETREVEGNSTTNGVATPLVQQEKSFKSFTPRAIVAYQIPDTANIYASYSRGFKSGAFNTVAVSQPAVSPEHLDAFELGVKSLFSANWRVNLALFYQNFSDIQLQAFSTTTSSAILTNAATGRSYGFEFELHGRLSPAFSIDAFTGYTDTKYENFTSAVVNLPRVGGFGLRTVNGVDVSGNPFIRVPKWTAGLTVNYNTELAGGELNASGNIYYRSSVFWDVSYNNAADPYATVNGDISWTPAGSRLSVGAFVRNLTDVNYQVGGNATGQTYYVIWAEPRTIGARVSLAFR